jgi:thermostable 8-oxoguanine DNA glycosylase
LFEEIGFCLLGGFGITAELNTAAFCRLRDAGVFDHEINIVEDDIRLLLIEPLQIDGRARRYRFPNQRARRLAAMRERIAHADLDPLSENQLRVLLLSIEGIGPKTAAWIIRNHFDSDAVAILDIHVIRASSRLNLFPEKVALPRDYDFLQERFLRLAAALEVRPAVLDAVMWTEMRNENRTRQRLAA